MVRHIGIRLKTLELAAAGLYFDVLVAVHNLPSMSAAPMSVFINHKTVLVCAQTLSAPIPAMQSQQ